TEDGFAVFLQGTYTQGLPINATLTNCKSGKDCLTFNTWIGISGPAAKLEFINSLNRALIIGRVALQDDGVSRLSVSVLLKGGVTGTSIAEQPVAYLGLFMAYMDERKKWENENKSALAGSAPHHALLSAPPASIALPREIDASALTSILKGGKLIYQ